MGDTKALVQSNKDKHEMKEYYAEIAQRLDNVIKYNQEFALTLKENLENYIREAQENKEPLTMAGLILNSGMTKDAYYSIRDKQYDWLLPSYMDRHDIPYDQVGTVYTDDEGKKVLLVRLSELVKTAELALQEDRERLCMDRNARNAAGAIFLLKAQQGLQDTPQDIKTSQTLNINVASLDEARQALKRLGE